MKINELTIIYKQLSVKIPSNVFIEHIIAYH